MLYIILLLILAVLLFGSSVVLGALGWALGFIVAAIALFWAGVTFGISTETWILGGIALVAVIGVAHYAVEAKRKAEEEKMGPEALAGYKRLVADAEAKVRAERDAKKR